MKLRFNNVHLHHFLSFDDADIVLSNRGYCLVSGINKNEVDMAASNGSGKSSIWSAICWALTGETIQGLHSNIPNIYFNAGCWVELNLTADNHEYKITRSKDDSVLGTNLKICLDGEDKSGKGIRESEDILSQYLPDLTPDLIGSVIILGQGLPHKFADNTPSGRKEILEKLSKSDFMIDDLKTRVSDRNNQLAIELRKQEDARLSITVQQNICELKIASCQAEKLKYDVEPDYVSLLLEYEKQLEEYSQQLVESLKQQSVVKIKKTALEADYQKLLSEKFNASQKLASEHAGVSKEYDQKRSALNQDIYLLNNEINRLKSIKDVCPTCGQKLPGVLKPDTSEQEKTLAEKYQIKAELEKEIATDQIEYTTACTGLENKYKDTLEEAQKQVADQESQLTTLSTAYMNIFKLKSDIETKKQIAENDKKLFLQNKQLAADALVAAVTQKTSLANSLSEMDIKIKSLHDHIDVVTKLNTLIKRDFRGFLLTNIINFIDERAKKYCEKIFKTTDLQFKLNGNNIDIQFCGKSYENLSGGEAQKINIILMLGIRDMMSTCLNFSSNILVLDEITDNLDTLGCEKIINLISEEMSTVESLFIISHRADELAIPYDQVIRVEKDSRGVSNII